MVEDILISPVDKREISLTGMSRRALRDLHYTEEIKMAKMILALPPFSEERKQLLNEGYDFVEALKLRYERNTNESFGASSASVKLVKDMIEQRKNRKKGTQIVYEAGVGTGYALRCLIELPEVEYHGCDVVLFPDVADMRCCYENLFLNERTLYEDLLEMRDNSIDVFYADNVIEHLLPDEADSIFEILHRKMKRGGQLILFIPNWHNGPHDVSMYYLKKGSRATGFHFMEMSYLEMVKFACRHGFKANYIARSYKSIERDRFGIKNLKRILMEQIISQIKNENVRFELMKNDNYTCYVFSK